MHNFDPTDINASRPPLGDRVPPRPSPVVPEQSQAELDARDQVLDEADSDVASWITDYRESMTRVAVRAGADLHMAEDAAQNAILKALQRRRQGFVPDKPGGWLAQVVWTEFMTFHRKNRLRQCDPTFLDDQIDAPDDRASALAEMMNRVGAEIKALHPPYERIVTLRLLEGFTIKQTADELDLPERTISRKYAMAIRAIRVRLADQFDDFSR